MTQIINFTDYSPDKTVSQSQRKLHEAYNINATITEIHVATEEEIQTSINQLLSLFPGKLAFTQREASKILGISYQFINRNCVTGLIKTIKFGDRQLINIHEMARLLNEGVFNGNK